MPGFPGGVNNVYREDTVPPTQLRSAVNVDLLPGGKVRRRKGYTRRVAFADARSGHHFLGFAYLADGAELKRVDLIDFSEETLAPIPPHAHLSYAEVNEFLYVASGEASQAYRVSPQGAVQFWSVEQPAGQPTLSAVGLGSLPAGRYQVAITYLRGREESGTGLAAEVTLAQEGGIQLSAIPAPERGDTTGMRVYLTNPNGTVLYAYSDFPPAPGATLFLTRLADGKQLETQFLEPLPVGHIVRTYRGRMYSAVGRFLYYSQALRYGLCNPAQDFVEFPGRISMVRPVENGIYVSAGKRTVFLSGANPAEFQQTIVHHAGAVEGTDTEVPAGMFSFENLSTGMVAVWWATSGVMLIGFPNGQVQPIREGELSLPEFARGATMLREEDGVQQLLSVLQQPRTPASALAISDEAVVTVHRRGIEI